MRRLITGLVVTVLLGSGLQLGAQPYTTAWPYLYSDFRDGVICMTGGQKIYLKLNLHLVMGRLHYLDRGIVKEALAKDIVYVEIASDKYLFINGTMMQVAAEQPGGFVADHITGDLESLAAGTGAYGMTANTEAVTRVSSLDFQQGVNTNHMLLLQEKDSGQEFDLRHEYFIVTGGKVYPAHRADILKMLPPDRRKDFTAFVKANKIRWNRPDRLILLVDFLKDF